MSKKQIAFTLIELLVVIAIIGILSALIIVGLGGMTQKATIAKAQVFSSSLRNSLLMNLVSEWKFDGSGVADGGNATTAYTQDSWSVGNNCTINGTPSVYSSSNCISGSCLNFNGSTDYLDCGNSNNLNLNNALTISVWVKTNQLYTDYWRDIVGRPTFSPYSIFAEWSAGGGYLRFEIDNSATRYTVSGPNFSGNVGQWMYMVGTYDSTVGILKTYYNGNLYNSNNIGAGKTIDPSSGSHLIVGGYNTNFFNGSIDEVRIYNAAIPISQIKEQYYAGLNKLLSNGGMSLSEYRENISKLSEYSASK